MTEMISLTLNGKTYDSFVDSVARSRFETFALIGSTNGEQIEVSDASDYKLLGLNLYGKSTQTGTPTPTAPVDIVSIGDDGGVNLSVCSKVLVDWSHTTLVGKPIFSHKGNRIKYENNSGEHCLVSSVPITLPVGTYTAYIRDMSDKTSGALVGVRGLSSTKYLSHGTPRIVLSITQPTTIDLIATTSNQTEKLAYSCYAGVVVGDVPIENCPMIDDNIPSIQTFKTTASLRATPVADKTLATYTDTSGKMWFADEIDLDRGARIQRIYKGVFDGSTDENIMLNIGTSGMASRFSMTTPLIKSGFVLSNYAVQDAWGSSEGKIGTGTPGNTVQTAYIGWSNTTSVTLAEFKTILASKPLVIIAPLAEPIETPLTAEEIAAYTALHTNKPNTTVLNNAGAYMELEYVMDAKKYIDSLVIAGGSSRLTNVTLRASAWKTESEGLHSQVVTVSGVTEYSKVDLLPSVEQLAIFHNKDVAFVTENEDGVVTVYAIGDKPTLDYTMQAQITEVVV